MASTMWSHQAPPRNAWEEVLFKCFLFLFMCVVYVYLSISTVYQVEGSRGTSTNPLWQFFSV